MEAEKKGKKKKKRRSLKADAGNDAIQEQHVLHKTKKSRPFTGSVPYDKEFFLESGLEFKPTATASGGFKLRAGSARRLTEEPWDSFTLSSLLA